MRNAYVLAVVFFVPAKAGEVIIPEPTGGNWQWSLSAGPAARNVGNLKVNSGYRSSGFVLPSLVGNETSAIPSIGSASALADRQYDDGYVRQDAGTSLDGLTWNWGYDDATQVQGGQLVFSATGSRSARRDSLTASAFGPARSESLRGIAPHIQLDGVSPHEIGGFRIGMSAGFDFTQVDQSLVFSNFAALQTRDDYRVDYTDSYDLNGVIAPIAPYAGAPGGPGPLIGNLPTSRVVTETLVNTESAFVSNLVDTAIDIDVFSLTFGPSLSRTHGRFGYGIQGGVILNVYHWEARQNEQLGATTATGSSTLAAWDESDSGTKFRPGVFAQGDITCRLNDEVSVGAYVRLDVATEFRAQAGPTVYKIDPTGFSTGLMIRYELP